MKKLSFVFLCLAVFSATAADVAHHPQPKEPKLIRKDLLPRFKRELILPPAAGSEVQRADETELLARQQSRQAADCDRAKSEVYVSLASFYGEPVGPLSSAQVSTYAAFFDQIRNDADYYIQLLKKEFPRRRPFLYVKGLEPCVPREVTGAYPSGHATLARLYALILAEIEPAKKDAFFKRGDVIAQDRVLAGVHHPTDIEAGRQLGEAIFTELRRSEAYRKAFAALPKTAPKGK